MDLNKHVSWFNPQSFKNRINIIGVGAIGSNMAEQLARLGFSNIHLFDFDSVEPHNITNQIYTTEDMYTLKTEAMAKKMKQINPEIKVTCHNEGWKEDTELQGFVILALDNIETRAEIVKEIRFNELVPFVLDMRIGLQQSQMYAADRSKLKRLLSNMQFKHSEVSVPVSACGTQMTVLPTIQSVVSFGTMNLIRYIKEGKYNYQTIIDTIQGIATTQTDK